MPLKALLVDFGGTLMDDESDRVAHRELLKAAAARYGWSTSPDELLRAYERFRRKSDEQAGGPWTPVRDAIEWAYGQILAEHGATASDADRAWFLREEEAMHRRHLRTTPGAKELLHLARDRGVHVGLLTDIDSDFLQVAADALGLTPFFDSVTTSEEVGFSKPNRRLFEVALERAGCEPLEAVMVGDSYEKDIQGALAMGIPAVHVTAEPGGGADYVVRDMLEARRVVERLL